MINGVLCGIVGGFIVALGGSYKDTLYEGFFWLRFFRSPVIGMFTGFIVGLVYPDLPLVALFGTSIAFERLCVETWKAVIRKKPGKFEMEGRDNEWLRIRFGRLFTKK